MQQNDQLDKKPCLLSETDSTRDGDELMTFTRVIGLRTTTGSFGGWGPRLVTPTTEVVKPN